MQSFSDIHEGYKITVFLGTSDPDSDDQEFTWCYRIKHPKITSSSPTRFTGMDGFNSRDEAFENAYKEVNWLSLSLKTY